MKALFLNRIITLTCFLLTIGAFAQVKTYEPGSFSEVIISPHVETEFIASNSERVEIHMLDVDESKLNVEVKGKTLNIYLDDAKVYTKSEKIKTDDYNGKTAIYHGTKVAAKIYYKQLNLVSLRGDEDHLFNGLFKGDKCALKIYGESETKFSELELEELNVTIYGESELTLDKGWVAKQKFVSYGESEINAMGIANQSSKVTAYGEGRIRLAVEDRLKVTAYGEASIHYKGNPDIDKGLVIGEARIHKVN